MKLLKRFLLEVFVWYFWHNFHCGLRSVLGHRTIAESLKEMKTIEAMIRLDNNLKFDEKITWENSKETSREIFAKYVTLRHFNEVGQLLSFFKTVDKKKILEGK